MNWWHMLWWGIPALFAGLFILFLVFAGVSMAVSYIVAKIRGEDW